MEATELKMYILVKQSVPTGIAIVSAVHAPLVAYLQYKDDELLKEWLEHSFKKVVCWVTDEEYESCKKLDRIAVITESNYGDKEIAIAVCPRHDLPRKFKYFPLVGNRIWHKRSGATIEFANREQELEYGLREVVKAAKARLEHARSLTGPEIKAKPEYLAALEEMSVFVEAEASRWLNRTFNNRTVANGVEA